MDVPRRMIMLRCSICAMRWARGMSRYRVLLAWLWSGPPPRSSGRPRPDHPGEERRSPGLALRIGFRQLPRTSSGRVLHIRANRGQLDALVDLLGDCAAPGNTAAHFGQVASRWSIVRSGFGCSVRPTPGRLLRGGRSVPGAGRSGFCPCDGGFEELPGVFGGWVCWLSRASRAAMRASCAAIR